MSRDWLQYLVWVVFGSLSGGLTNTIAIWMLFHPYTPPKIGKREIRFLQGAIPKNQARLASAVGRTVGTRLLTDEDLQRTFGDEEFRAAFDRRLAGFVESVLHTERGSVRELLPTDTEDKASEIKDDVVDFALEHLNAYLHSERFENTIHARAGEIIQSIADEPVGDLLTPSRGQAISTAIDEWITDAVESDDFADAVNDYMARAATSLLQDDRTFEEVLPGGLVGTLENAIAGYLPLAIQRLGAILEDEEARERFERFVHDLLHGFLNDLAFHQKIVAKLIMTESTIDKVLDTIEAEGAQRLTEMLQEPELQEAMSGGVNQAIVDFLRRPVTSVVGTADSESVLDAQRTISNWLVGIVQDPNTRGFVVEKLESGLEKAGASTWGEVFEKLPASTITEWLVAGARSEAAQGLYRETAHRIANNILDQPIGRPSDWLPPEAVRGIETGLSEPIWNWLQTQVPDVVSQINVAKRVEDKVLEFPTAKMEDLVRRVTDRELRVIVKLGYALGGMIGIMLIVIDLLWPTG